MLLGTGVFSLGGDIQVLSASAPSNITGITTANDLSLVASRTFNIGPARSTAAASIRTST